MRAALSEPDLFGSVLAGNSWEGWRTLLIAMVGEELTAEERIAFERFTGRPKEPLEPVEEAFLIIGRRSGKTRAVAILGAYLASLCDWTGVLAPGERASVLILSASLRQATKALQYIDGIFAGVPALKAMVRSRSADGFQLSNSIDIEVTPSNWRTARGGTAVGILVDELAYWRDADSGSANPAEEVLAGARPMLMTTAPLIAISSPHARKGPLWEAYRRDWGPEGDRMILVAKAPSKALNPTLSQARIDRAFERDFQMASADYNAEFRNDVAGFLDFAIVEAAIDYGVTVRPPRAGVQYRSGCDPSGGARDSFTLSVCHDEDDGLSVVDCLVEIPSPFNPTEATKQIADVLRSYGLTSTIGDAYAKEWVVNAFAKESIEYLKAPFDRSTAYLNLLPMFTSGRVRLLDNKRLASQFTSLERRALPGGRDRVDHGRGGFDDCANATALALVAARTDDVVREFVRAWSDADGLREFDKHLADQRRVLN